MSTHDVHPGNEAGSGFDAASGLSGDSQLSRDMFGQPLHKTPTALDNPYAPLLETGNAESGAADPLTGMTTQQHQGAGAYGDEFRSGIAPIDYAANLAGKAMDAVEQAVETNAPVVQKAIHEAVAQMSESVQHTVETVQQNWNAPDNEVRTTLHRRVNQTIGLFKQKIGDLAADPEVQNAIAAVTRLGQTVAAKTENLIETAQAKTETWMGQAFESVYVDQSLTAASAKTSPSAPFIGVIDTDFQAEGHGAQVVDTIRQAGQRFPDWLGDGVGSGRWADELIKFVDAARASGRTGAVVNLSFDLTQINPDGSVTTRTKLTSAEWNALKYAQNHDVLIVVAAGNQGGTMSALGQASKEFDNIITVGAVENGQRADYSSYGSGLNLVASGDGDETEGTSLAAARVSAAAAGVWAANSTLSYQQVVHILESTATDLGPIGWDTETASGKLNAKTAVVSAQDTLEQPLPMPNSDSLNPGTPQLVVGVATGGMIASERPASVDVFNTPVIQKLANAFEGSSLDGLEGKPHTSREKTASPASVLLQYGDGIAQPSENVRDWQAFLNSQGLSRQLTEDGQFGANTKAMTIEFQTRQDLPADGIVGEQTKAAAQEKGYGGNIFNTPVIQKLANAFEGSSLGGLEGTADPDLLQYGDGVTQSSENVRDWQAFLNSQGLSMQLVEDGQFGANTKSMTIEFQSKVGIEADGIVGSKTRAAASSNNLDDSNTNLEDLNQASFELVSFQSSPCTGSQAPAAGGRIEHRIQEEFEKQYPDATYEVNIPHGSEIVKGYDENRNPIHADGRADIVLAEDGVNEVYEIKPNDTPGRYQSQIDRYIEQGQNHCSDQWKHGDNQFVKLIDMGNEELLVFTDHENYPGLILYDRRQKDPAGPRVPTSPPKEQQEEEQASENPSVWERVKAGASQFAEDVKELPEDLWDALSGGGASDEKPGLPDTL